MTLEQLRIFVAVAERQHMTHAAEALGLTQPAVSAAIAVLEGRFATRLFHRVGRHIELTEAGRLLLAEAREVLARAAAVEQAMSELAHVARGTLTLHASQTIANNWLPARLHRFRIQHAAVKVVLHIGNTEEALRALREGGTDLALVEGEADDGMLVVRPVARDRLAMVVAPAHPLARARRIDAAMLAAADWVAREPGSGTRAAFAAALAGLGVPEAALRIGLELPSNEAVRAAAEAGAGAAILSELVVADAVRAGLLSRVAVDLPERAFSLVRHRDRFLAAAARAFTVLLESEGSAPQ